MDKGPERFCFIKYREEQAKVHLETESWHLNIGHVNIVTELAFSHLSKFVIDKCLFLFDKNIDSMYIIQNLTINLV
jgi:hypothetical protein